MVATIQQIIGKVNPELYAENGKELLKKYGSINKIPSDKIKPKPSKDKDGNESVHTLIYDSPSEALEPVYFFILDLMNDFGLAPEKLIDNFVSSPGSGHFSELGQRATVMQQQATNLMGQINTLLRSVLNIVHDLKDFKMRLRAYDDLKSKEENIKEGAKLSLKQIWLDKVDITKGQSSIKGMALGQADFQTLLDAFLVAKNEKDAEKIDLNERVKRIVKSRIYEFNIWLTESEKELRKRYELEKSYLKSQVNSLKLYSRWAKPYLKAAQKLEMKSEGIERDAALVKTFNTILLELTLLGKNKLKVKESSLEGDLPSDFSNERFLKTLKRNYFSCILIDFKFRGIPNRVSQRGDYSFGGKTEVTFSSYALNDDELKKIDEELKKSDLGDVLKLIEGATDESLNKMQEEINMFLEEKENEKNKKSSNSEVGPFSALIGSYKKSDKSKKKDSKKKDEKKSIKIQKDSWIEKNHIRPLALEKATETVFTLFDIYKKAHQMPSYT